MERFVIAALAAVGLSSVAGAQVDLRLDMSDLVGQTAGNWNNISNLTGTTSNLIDFPTGAATSVNITGAGEWEHFFGDDFLAFPEQDWVVHPSTADGAGLQAGLTGVFTVTGLTAASYRVEIVSARTVFNYQNFITVGGATADRTFLGTPVATPWGSTSDGLNAGNWLIWDDVQPVRGLFNIVLVADQSTLGMINAIRIYEVPSPGSSAIAGLVLVAAGRRRRA
jgi:hypothetical protein